MVYRYKSDVERVVRDHVETIDYAILMLRRAGDAERADKLAKVRDFLSRSDAYFRRLQDMRLGGRGKSTKDAAEQKWSDLTGKSDG